MLVDIFGFKTHTSWIVTGSDAYQRAWSAYSLILDNGIDVSPTWVADTFNGVPDIMNHHATNHMTASNVAIEWLLSAFPSRQHKQVLVHLYNTMYFFRTYRSVSDEWISTTFAADPFIANLCMKRK
jgi:hypothetical protein